MTTEADRPPAFPLYLVLAFNNLDALLEGYSRTADIRMLREALSISCRDLKRAVRDNGLWQKIHETLGITDDDQDYPLSELRAFNTEEFLTFEADILLRAAAEPGATNRQVAKAAKAVERAQRRDAPRFARRLRARIDELADHACARQYELLMSDGWPKETDDRSGYVTFVRCFEVIGGLVVAGANVFGAVHVPVAVPLAKESVMLGLDMVERGLTAPDTEFG